MSTPITLTGVERTFPEDEFIVSKTDTKGRITYANDVFLKISGFTEDEIVGQPHSIIRNPEMPRCVFKLLWDTIGSGNEIFAYPPACCKGINEETRSTSLCEVPRRSGMCLYRHLSVCQSVCMSKTNKIL